MNSSLVTADGATHLRIVMVAALACAAVIGVGLSARIAASTAWSPAPRLEQPAPDRTPPAVARPRATVVV